MPQVASDPTIYSHSPTTPRQARPAQQSDRAASPFESLLDEGASPLPPPPRRHRKTRPRTPTSSRASSKPNDCKAPPANDGITGKKADETRGDTNGDDNTSSEGIKATLSAVVTGGVSCTEEGKPTADKKPTVAAHPEDPTAAQPADTDQTTTAGAFAGSVTAPASPVTLALDQIGPKEPEGDTSLAVNSTLQLSALAPSPPKIAGKQTGLAKQPDTEQPVEAEQNSSETGQQFTACREKCRAAPYRQIANCCRRE